MSLANKYRPQTFDEMIGQEHIIDILKAQMQARESVHHNYLLFGPRGTGKTTSARLIAKGLNCLDLQNGNPCNHCANCELINKGTSLDYTEIDAASHTGVDNIREEIIDKALYPPTALRKKIYVIDEVHMLSKGAFNALLKTIEEPKSNVCFIFATTEIHKVPDTIISRCQVFNYRKVPNPAMVQHLTHITQAEGLEASSEALNIIANISEGCVRDAVKYVDQVSILGAINEENITRFLGVAGEATIKKLLETMKKADRNAIFAQLDEISQSGIDLGQFAKQAISYIDQHLLEDTDFFLQCSEVFGQVLSTLRRYPYPLIAYKIAINKLLNSAEWGVQSAEWKGNSEQWTVKSEQWTVNSEVSSIQAAAITPLQPEAKIAQEEKKLTPSQESAPQENAPIQPMKWAAPEANPVENSSEPSTNPASEVPTLEPATPAPAETQTASTETPDFKALWNAVVAKIPKPTVQSNLKEQAIIEKIEGEQVVITVITKIAEMLLNNEENRKLIEQLLSEQLQKTIQISFTYESKESYFSRKMGL